MAETDVLELTRKLGREPNVDTALHILQWELGDLAKACVYTKWHPNLANAYREEAGLALASLLFQSRVVISLLGLNLDNLITLGEDIVKERIQEKLEKVGRFEHYVGEKVDKK